MDDKYCTAGERLCIHHGVAGGGTTEPWRCCYAITANHSESFEVCPVPSRAREIKPKVKKYQVLYQSRTGEYCLSVDRYVSLAGFVVLYGNNPTPIKLVEETMIEE